MSLTLFAEDFDLPRAAAVQPDPLPDAPAPLPPTYDQEAFDAACAQARADGHAEGIAVAAAATAAQNAASLVRIADHLSEAAAVVARETEESAAAFARVLFASLLAGFPRLRALHGEEELRAIIRRAMPGLLRETRVVFHVHPTVVPMTEAELATVPLRERQHMTIAPSEDIPVGDARIAWPNGAAVRNTVAIEAAIAEILGQLGLLPEPAATGAEPR